VLAILLLNQLDAFCTIRHLDHGARELNPIMAELLVVGHGGTRFVIIKHLLVSLGLFIIVLRSDRRLARMALSGAFALFACVAIYQTALLVTT
jgi:hypothetical protein